MTQLVVQLKSEEKAKMLSEFLSALAFVNSVKLTKDEPIQQDTENDFFSLAGLWKDRNISQESIRIGAWPENNQ